MPNMPRTPARTIRVDDPLWEAATRKAAERGEPLSAAIRDFLRRYVKRP